MAPAEKQVAAHSPCAARSALVLAIRLNDDRCHVGRSAPAEHRPSVDGGQPGRARSGGELALERGLRLSSGHGWLRSLTAKARRMPCASSLSRPTVSATSPWSTCAANITIRWVRRELRGSFPPPTSASSMRTSSARSVKKPSSAGRSPIRSSTAPKRCSGSRSRRPGGPFCRVLPGFDVAGWSPAGMSGSIRRENRSSSTMRGPPPFRCIQE